jgi:hypothetical protein
MEQSNTKTCTLIALRVSGDLNGDAPTRDKSGYISKH